MQQFVNSVIEQRQGEPGFADARRVAEVFAAIERSWHTERWEQITSVG